MNANKINGNGVKGNNALDLLVNRVNEELYATPMRDDAHEISAEEKISIIEHHFRQIMDTLGLDMTDDSLSNTPNRVAKMYVNEIFSGLDPNNKPSVTLFDNKYQYRQMLVERDIPVQSTCEHHFQAIVGHVHIAYIASGQVIGLSKLNRIVEYYARRPQVQERLTVQIAHELKKVLKTPDVAVYMVAKHMCVEARGVKHHGCKTVTSSYHGKFLNEHTKSEFLQAIKD